MRRKYQLTRNRVQSQNRLESLLEDERPSFQQIAFRDQETGECGERRLNQSDGEAEKYYRDLQQRGVSVRVGMEAAGYSRLVRAVTGRIGFRGVDWPCGGDQEAARPEAENAGVVRDAR
jgi:hypothetical protein